MLLVAALIRGEEEGKWSGQKKKRELKKEGGGREEEKQVLNFILFFFFASWHGLIFDLRSFLPLLPPDQHRQHAEAVATSQPIFGTITRAASKLGSR